MFFADRAKAVSEMHRVLRPGGRMAIAVWGPAEAAPGYAAMITLLEDLFGKAEADALRAPFGMGRLEDLVTLFDDAGLPRPEIEVVSGTARFPSVAAWVEVDYSHLYPKMSSCRWG